MSTTETAARETEIPQHLPERLRRHWRELAGGGEGEGVFTPGLVRGLPAAARRWLLHAIAPGTPLRTRVELAQHGRIKLGSWRPFTAAQVLAPLEGYIWAERTGVAGLKVSGYDRLTHGEGEMRHRLLGFLPLVSATGPDLTRAAAGRQACEIVFAPAAALDPSVTWRDVDDRTAVAVVPAHGWSHEVTLTVRPSGELDRATLDRWAKVGKGPYRRHPFTAVFEGEGTFDGYTIPTRVIAGYGEGSAAWKDGAFITQIVDRAVYR
ncbi:DUF6544 family protein [Actinocorallia sp. B10E7]|uniref:DUF6544 family protein n=1 Tax=Actinocorallia sp. B10E7 TaxID=3153558 RepID=UPI00325E1EBD